MTPLGLALLALIPLAVSAVLLWLARPPRMRGSGDLRLHRLGEGVYLYRGYFSNSAVLVFPAGVLVVDTQVSPVAARRLRAEIERTTDRPIRYVVNTHYHGDHTGGNAVFPEAETIGTADCLRFVHERDGERLEYAQTFGLLFDDFHPTTPPQRTFSGRLVLEDLGETVEILQLGRSETPDACVVHVPSRGVLVTGDAVATIHYPYLGVPLLDEGLRDDGEWVGALDAMRALRPRLLLPGHGIPLVGERQIAARLDLLSRLFRDLLAAVKRELAAGTPLPALVDRVSRELAHYPRRAELREYTVSQRFAIYRCVNNLSPERKGRGWWHDLRPSVIRRADPEKARRALAGAVDPIAQALAAANAGDRPLAIAMLEAVVAQNPGDAKAWAELADVFFDGARGVRPTVDATEYIVAATRAAKEALARDPNAQVALLNLGIAEVFGAMVLAQPMTAAIAKLESTLARGGLTPAQRRKAQFFLGKAHQLELRLSEADGWYRRALPWIARPLYPVLRERIYAYP